METTTKLSSKGQVIIPKAVRDAHHWRAGMEFTVEDTPGGILLKPKKLFPPTTLEQGLGCAGYAGPPLSWEEIEHALEEDIRRTWSPT